MPGTWLMDLKIKMDGQHIFEILGIFALSAVKFGIAGVPAAVFAKFPFFKAVSVTASGGIVGTIVFTYLSEGIINLYHRIKQRLTKKKSKPPKKFTRANRLVVLTKKKFGLIGLSIITPLLLSIPLGVFLAVRYYENKEKIIFSMSLSICAWAVILYFFYNYFYEKVSAII